VSTSISFVLVNLVAGPDRTFLNIHFWLKPLKTIAQPVSQLFQLDSAANQNSQANQLENGLFPTKHDLIAPKTNLK